MKLRLGLGLGQVSWGQLRLSWDLLLWQMFPQVPLLGKFGPAKKCPVPDISCSLKKGHGWCIICDSFHIHNGNQLTIYLAQFTSAGFICCNIIAFFYRPKLFKKSDLLKCSNVSPKNIPWNHLITVLSKVLSREPHCKKCVSPCGLGVLILGNSW